MTVSGLPAISGKTMRFERHLDHPIERVWHVLTDEAETAYWFPARIVGRREPGAPVTFEFENLPLRLMDDELAATIAAKQAELDTSANPEFLRGKVVAFDPPRLFELDWAGEIIRFELTPHAGGTKLVFLYTWLEGTAPQGVGPGWHFTLAGLAKRLSGDTTPQTAAEFHEMEAVYKRLLA